MKNGKLVTLAAFAVLTVSAFGGKILYVDSYHEGYAWSDGLTESIKASIGTKAELKVHRMDTKRKAEEADKLSAAEEAKALIESWKPDVVIVSDDNASKYVIAPYFKDGPVPVVFCGVNWDCSVYGFPTDYVCGMEEVGLVTPLLTQLKKYADGEKIGYLSVDNLTAHNEAENWKKKFGVEMTERYVKTAEEWKQAFLEIQKEVDVLILENNAGIADWDDEAMTAFVSENIHVPTGSIQDWMMPYCVIGYTKLSSEQGAWAADAALKILKGKSPKDIGVAQNKQGQLYVNLGLAKSLDVSIPMATLKKATIIK